MRQKKCYTHLFALNNEIMKFFPKGGTFEIFHTHCTIFFLFLEHLTHLKVLQLVRWTICCEEKQLPMYGFGTIVIKRKDVNVFSFLSGWYKLLIGSMNSCLILWIYFSGQVPKMFIDDLDQKHDYTLFLNKRIRIWWHFKTEMKKKKLTYWVIGWHPSWK